MAGTFLSCGILSLALFDTKIPKSTNCYFIKSMFNKMVTIINKLCLVYKKSAKNIRKRQRVILKALKDEGVLK